MKTEDLFLVRALLHRMKLEANTPAAVRTADTIIEVMIGCGPLASEPQISWAGDTMVVR